ncbi:MAG TPA: hypothetical protein PK854_04155 [Oscillospiraceae bacterium]|nr:hypothetical protein [Oscillospiraceae bacterium]
MKKLFKLAVSLFICGLLLLSGCGSVTTTSLPKELIEKSGDYPKSINLIAPDFFKYTGAPNAEEAKQKWLDDMSERYGVNINIFGNYGEANKSGSGSSSLRSVNKSSVHYLPESYIPLDDYLADNPVWNSLPEDFKSLFKVKGHIYAIPASVSEGVLKARVFHDEALLTAGVTVTDLNSFLAFAENYRKKNGYPVDSSVFSGVTDILNAFGLFPGTDEYTPFSYDPTADCYVDWLTKPAAAGALEYIQKLNNYKSLAWKNAEQIDELFNSGMLASRYVPYYDYINCTEVFTLNPEYPQMISTEIRGFAMTADTPQPKETINFLVDMLFGSQQCYLECWLGSDNYILNSDGTLTIKMSTDSEGNAVFPCCPNLASGLTELFPFSDANISYSQSGDDGTDIGTDADAKNKARLKMFSDSLENGSLVKIPQEYQVIQSAAYDANWNEVATRYYVDIILHAIEPTFKFDKTVQQLVDEYKAAMLALGGNQMLDEMNAAIGKKTAYYYG